jgi:hypothetical protein
LGGDGPYDMLSVCAVAHLLPAFEFAEAAFVGAVAPGRGCRLCEQSIWNQNEERDGAKKKGPSLWIESARSHAEFEHESLLLKIKMSSARAMLLQFDPCNRAGGDYPKSTE